MRDGVTFCSDGTPVHVDIGLYGCGNNIANAFLGTDCVADHYWNVGTTAQGAWMAAQVNTTLSAGVNAGDKSMSVTSVPASLVNGTILTVDSGTIQEDVTASCSGSCSNPITISGGGSGGGFKNAHSTGVNVIGALVPCADIGDNHVTDPYDDRVAWLSNAVYNSPPPTPNPISIDNTVDPVNSFVNHWNNTASGDGGEGSNLSNEAFEYGDSCHSPSPSLPKQKWSNNMASALFIIAISSELRGAAAYPSVTIDGLSLNSLNYHWNAVGSSVTGLVCPSSKCVEPSDHINEYPVIWWDRGFTVPQCMTGVSSTEGAFVEIESGTGNTVLTTDPALDSARLLVTARFDHANTASPAPGASPLGKWIDGSSILDGRPLLFIVNGGDCQQSTQPAFQSSFAWQSGNVLAVNGEDPFVNTSTCGQLTGSGTGKEPTRLIGAAQFALNSETIFASHRIAWQNEDTCAQNSIPGPGGGTTTQNNGGGTATCAPATRPVLCAGGLDDVSLRYWLIGNEMLFADYRYVWSRHNLIGAGGNDVNALDVVGEDFIIALDPVKVVQPYSEPSSSPNPSGNGCTGNGSGGGANYGNDSGGIMSVAIPMTCATASAPPPGEFFKVSPAVSQQWQECYVHGTYVGPCAAVGNYRDVSYQDMTSGLTQTFGTELVAYAHILDLNDGLNNAPPCAPASPSAVGGTYVSPCAQDVFESTGLGPCITGTGPVSTFNGTCLDVTDYAQEAIVKSGKDQTVTCTQGLDASGHLTVCPREYVILFR